MPTIQNLTMSLQPVGGGVHVTVNYRADFSPIELFLIANGLVVEERIHFIGDDEATAGGNPVYSSSPEPIAPGPNENHLLRNRQLELPRAQLQEDPSRPIYRYITLPNRPPIRYIVGYTPDDDELHARVELKYAGFMPQSLADTPLTVLAG